MTKPTAADLRAAHGKTVADVIGPGLEVLFCGINPGLYSAAVGHHFARPGNRFWPALQAAAFSDRLLTPFEERELLPGGYGITNVVARATASAEELTPAEIRAGARRLARKVARLGPNIVAVLGISVYRIAFDRPNAKIGPQTEKLAGSRLWVLPNPSGLNAHYQLAELTEWFRRLRHAAKERGGATDA